MWDRGIARPQAGRFWWFTMVGQWRLMMTHDGMMLLMVDDNNKQEPTSNPNRFPELHRLFHAIPNSCLYPLQPASKPASKPLLETIPNPPR